MCAARSDAIQEPHQFAQVVPGVRVKQILAPPVQVQQVAAEPHTTLPHWPPVVPPDPLVPPAGGLALQLPQDSLVTSLTHVLSHAVLQQ